MNPENKDNLRVKSKKERKTEASKKSWVTRRILYLSNGMSPKGLWCLRLRFITFCKVECRKTKRELNVMSFLKKNRLTVVLFFLGILVTTTFFMIGYIPAESYRNADSRCGEFMSREGFYAYPIQTGILWWGVDFTQELCSLTINLTLSANAYVTRLDGTIENLTKKNLSP